MKAATFCFYYVCVYCMRDGLIMMSDMHRGEQGAAAPSFVPPNPKRQPTNHPNYLGAVALPGPLQRRPAPHVRRQNLAGLHLFE